MSVYSVAEAKNRLPSLIARAERGEDVTITRRGKPVAKLSSVAPAPAAEPPPWDPVTDPGGANWLREQHRLIYGDRVFSDGAALIREMRDEERF